MQLFFWGSMEVFYSGESFSFFGAITFLYGFVRIERRFLPPCGTTKPCNEKIFLRRSTKKRRRRNSFLLPFLRIFVIARYQLAAGSLGDDAADLVFKAAGFIVDDASGKLN